MLRAIKLAHTVVWAVLVAIILAIPVMAWRGQVTDRRANFDIYSPLWLAATNKRLVGSVFAAGVVFSIWRPAR